MINHAALAKMKSAAANYGLSATCKTFSNTHDVGFGPYAWLFEANHIIMPETEINPGHEGVGALRPNTMIVHAMRFGPDDHCGDDYKRHWRPDMKWNESFIIGCGDVDHPLKDHDKAYHSNMYDAYEYFRTAGQPSSVMSIEWMDMIVLLHDTNSTEGKPRIKQILGRWNPKIPVTDGGVKRRIPLLAPLLGYNTTAHSHKYNVTEQWHPFLKEDCAIPGELPN